MNHLIPPFIMKEAVITVNDTPTIQLEDLYVSDLSILFEESKVRLPLSRRGVFLYHPTTKPTENMLNSCEELY